MAVVDGEVDAEQRDRIIEEWTRARATYLNVWSESNQRAYERFRNSFVEAASARWGIPKGAVRRVVQGPK